jgi:hypothetical protein
MLSFYGSNAFSNMGYGLLILKSHKMYKTLSNDENQNQT